MKILFAQLLNVSIVVVLFLGSSCSGMPQIVLPSDPLTPEEHVTLGAAYDEEGLQEEARRQFQAALDQRADSPGAIIGLGNLSFKERQYEMAEEYYMRALSIAPGHPGATNNLVAVYVEENKNLAVAEQLAKQALVAAGRLRPYLLQTLATVYIRQQRFDEARTLLHEAEVLTPQTHVTLRNEIAKAWAQVP